MLEDTVLELNSLKEQIALLETRRHELEAVIRDEITHEIDQQLGEKDVPTGTVNVDLPFGQLKVNFPKQVKYDQDQFNLIWKSIKKNGYEPRDFMRIKYDVLESAYQTYPAVVKDIFLDARTISVGRPRFDIKFNKVED